MKEYAKRNMEITNLTKHVEYQSLEELYCSSELTEEIHKYHMLLSMIESFLSIGVFAHVIPFGC